MLENSSDGGAIYCAIILMFKDLLDYAKAGSNPYFFIFSARLPSNGLD